MSGERAFARKAYNMSRNSKITLAASIIFTTVTISFVYYLKEAETKVMMFLHWSFLPPHALTMVYPGPSNWYRTWWWEEAVEKADFYYGVWFQHFCWYSWSSSRFGHCSPRIWSKLRPPMHEWMNECNLCLHRIQSIFHSVFIQDKWCIA